MKIHEYQAKDLLRAHGVPVPRGHAAFTVREAVEAAQKLGGTVWVVKAQIHAGGRGKGGGVKVAKSMAEVKELAGKILGMQLVTHQTGPAGRKVGRLLIEEGADIKKELYVALVVDRVTQRATMMASSEGGMDIEEVAAHTPEKIHRVAIDPKTGLKDAEAEDIRIAATWNSEWRLGEVYGKALSVPPPVTAPAGQAWECVELSKAKGEPSVVCFDSKTHLRVLEKGVQASQGGQVPYVTRFSDWRPIDGVLVWHHEEVTVGPVTMEGRIVEIVFDEHFPATLFSLPR
jgi:hypothetical protein